MLLAAPSADFVVIGGGAPEVEARQGFKEGLIVPVKGLERPGFSMGGEGPGATAEEDFAAVLSGKGGGFGLGFGFGLGVRIGAGAVGRGALEGDVGAPGGDLELFPGDLMTGFRPGGFVF